MLIFSMSVSVDGFINDRNGAFAWTAPDDETFAFHLARVCELGAHLCGRRLYETMLPWETDPGHAQYAAVGRVRRRLVGPPEGRVRRTLDRVEGSSRLAGSSVAEEVAAAQATGRDVEIGGATLAGQAFELGLIDELRIFRHPVVVGGGTPYLPPVTQDVPLDLLETSRFGGGVVYERYRVVHAPRG